MKLLIKYLNTNHNIILSVIGLLFGISLKTFYSNSEYYIFFIFIFLYILIIYFLLNLKKKEETFNYLLYYSDWEDKFIDNVKIWISKDNNSFRIKEGDKYIEYNEEYVNKFPDKNGKRFKCKLEKKGIEIDELDFLFLDGFRVIIPMPEKENGNYYLDRNSLKYRIGNIIGKKHFGNYKKLDEVLFFCGIEIK